MKPTVATALSVAGVLGAGALAIAANMAVFAGPADSTEAGILAADAATADGPAPSGAATATAGDRLDSVGVQAFRAGPAGTVTLDAAGGLHLVAAHPAPGWRVDGHDTAAGRVDVHFESDDQELTATAVLGADGIRVTLAGDDGIDDRDGERSGEDDSEYEDVGLDHEYEGFDADADDD